MEIELKGGFLFLLSFLALGNAATTQPSVDISTTVESPSCYYCPDDTLEECRNATLSQCSDGEVCYATLTSSYPDLFVELGCQLRQNCEIEQNGGSYNCSPDVPPPDNSICHYCCDSLGCNSDFIYWEIATDIPFEETTVIVQEEETTLVFVTSDDGVWTSGVTASSTLSTSTTLSPPVRNESLFCYECLEIMDEPPYFCNVTASQTECDNVDEVCYWSVRNENGSLFSSKGCKPRQECSQESSGNSNWCAQNVVSERCTWCCEDGDLCNYDRGDYQTEPVCQPEWAWRCLPKFEESIADAVTDPAAFFSQFCRNIPDIYRCLNNAVSGCCAEEAASINSTFEQILSNMTSLCPKECNLGTGVNCTLEYYEAIVLGIANGENCFYLGGIQEEQTSCILQNTGSCAPEDREHINSTQVTIDWALSLHCDVNRTDGPPGNPGNDTDCMAEDAKVCILSLGAKIMRYLLAESSDLAYICSSAEGAVECVKENTMECPEDVKSDLELALEFTINLLGDKCEDINEPKCETSVARMCVLHLWELVDEAKDFQAACNILPNVTWCVEEHLEACTDREKESIYQLFNVIINDKISTRCEEAIYVQENRTLEISECGNEEYIEYEILQPPDVLCGNEAPCEVYVEFDLELGEKPKCRGRKGWVIPQAVFGAAQDENACSRLLTSDNWQGKVQVPVKATIDYKRDKHQTRRLTMWLTKIKNGDVFERRSLADFTLYIEDCDEKAECKSINDPHTTTFDNWYYNNFMEGHFIMYRHLDWPYEVQMIGQRCHGSATCNCGAGVKVGDTVFFIDMCRRSNQGWCNAKGSGSKSGKSKSKHKYKCHNLLKATWSFYSPQGVTPGLRVFRKHNGKHFDVIFPHGTHVKITIQGQYLNLWITPSPLDFRKTEGLCGYYDGDRTNDFKFPNGSQYGGADWDQWGGQPKHFIKAWRARGNERIWKGVPKNPFTPPRYCSCSTENDGTIVANCGQSAHLDLCNFNLDNEITGIIDEGPNLPPIYEDNCSKSKSCKSDKSKRLQKSYGDDDLQRRVRRQEEVPEDDALDIDETWDPPLIDDASNESSWNRTTARVECENYFASTASAKTCMDKVAGLDVGNDVDGCVEDLIVTGDTEWMKSTLEAIKQSCATEINSNPDYAEGELADIADEIAKISCPQECNQNGNCVDGACECDIDFTGSDCSFNLTADIMEETIANEGLCDIDGFPEHCQYAEVVGFGFVPDRVQCHIKEIEVTDSGVVDTDEPETTVSADVFSPNQVRCPLTTPGSRSTPGGLVKSYSIELSNEGGERTDPVVYIRYNSVCYSCIAGEMPICTRTGSSCIIENECIVQGTNQEGDVCSYCDPARSDSQWSTQDTLDCRGLTKGQIAAIVVPSLVVVALLCVMGVLIHKRNNRRRAYDKKPDEMEKIKRDQDIIYDNPGYVFQTEDAGENYSKLKDPNHPSDYTAM